MKYYSFDSFSFPNLLKLITFALPIETFLFHVSVRQSQLPVLFFFPFLVLPRSRPDSSIISAEPSNVSQSASRDVMDGRHCGLLPEEISVEYTYMLHPTQKCHRFASKHSTYLCNSRNLFYSLFYFHF